MIAISLILDQIMMHMIMIAKTLGNLICSYSAIIANKTCKEAKITLIITILAPRKTMLCNKNVTQNKRCPAETSIIMQLSSIIFNKVSSGNSKSIRSSFNFKFLNKLNPYCDLLH
jgi:hypothetical protein